MSGTETRNVTQDEVILHRKDIVKYLDKHGALFSAIKGDISLIAQTYAKAGKGEYTDICMSYLDCVQVAEDMKNYLLDCMQQGIKNAAEERGLRYQKEGD